MLITTGGSPFQSSGTTHKTEILTKLAAQRTDIRIFAINASDTDLQFLATVGNGIVFESTIDKFPEVRLIIIRIRRVLSTTPIMCGT